MLGLRLHLGNRRYLHSTYHRMAALSALPCTTDHLGREVEPFQVHLRGLTQGLWDTFWEVDHWDEDSRNNRLDNLYILWWRFHRSR